MGSGAGMLVLLGCLAAAAFAPSSAFNSCPSVALRGTRAVAALRGTPLTVAPPLLRPRRRLVPILLATGDAADRSDEIAEWEDKLEEAIMDNDTTAINQIVKKLEKLQGKNAGSAPFNKKAVSGEDFHNKVLEALGDIVEAPSEATESVAEALQQSAEETINLELAAAAAALDDAVRDGDTEGIEKAAKLIEALQGSSAGSQPPDAPGGVDDELADAIAAAAIDEGDDVDTLGVLEGGAAALKAAEMTFEEAVATGDAVTIENAALVLSRLVQGASPFELSQDADKSMADAMSAVGVDGSAKDAAMEVAAAIAALEDELGGAIDDQDEDEEESEEGGLLGGVEEGLRARGLDALLDEAVDDGEERAILDVVSALGSIRRGSEPFAGSESIDAAAQDIVGREVSTKEVDDFAAAIAGAEEEDDDGIDPFELLADGGKGALDAAAAMLEDAVERGDEEGAQQAIEALSRLGQSGDAPPPAKDGVEAELADAIAAAELAETQEFDEGEEEEEEEEGEYYEEEEEEEGGSRVVTGWDDAGGSGGGDASIDEYVDEGLSGESWVAKSRALAELEAANYNCVVVDCRWTRGKLLIKVEHEDPDNFSVGITECERISRSLGFRLDNADFMEEDKAYNLVVSTPGAKEILTREREFQAFKGFPITVTFHETFKKKDEITGSLHDRDNEILSVNCKGRIVKVPLSNVKEVRLVQDQTQAP